MSPAARRVPGEGRTCGSSVREPNSVSQLTTALAWPSFLHHFLCVHSLISTHPDTAVTKLFTLYQIIAYTKSPVGVEMLKVNNSFSVRTEHTRGRFVLQCLGGI
jgi:hypothetical protein